MSISLGNDAYLTANMIGIRRNFVSEHIQADTNKQGQTPMIHKHFLRSYVTRLYLKRTQSILRGESECKDRLTRQKHSALSPIETSSYIFYWITHVSPLGGRLAVASGGGGPMDFHIRYSKGSLMCMHAFWPFENFVT